MEPILTGLKAILPENADVTLLSLSKEQTEGKEDVIIRRTKFIEQAMNLVRKAYTSMEEKVGDTVVLAEVEKAVMLRTIDDLWIDHLEAMTHLRQGIGLQGYGQRDPLVEYKREAYRMFNQMLAAVHQRVARMIFRIQIAKQTAEQELAQMAGQSRPIHLLGAQKEMGEAGNRKLEAGSFAAKVGRNDACPCGSGKKYKKCHGA
jgi:preprotein translocase subunit SecA